jgi:hypothetical protein
MDLSVASEAYRTGYSHTIRKSPVLARQIDERDLVVCNDGSWHHLFIRYGFRARTEMLLTPYFVVARFARSEMN